MSSVEAENGINGLTAFAPELCREHPTAARHR